MEIKKNLMQFFFPSVHCRACGERSARDYPGLCSSCREKLAKRRGDFRFCSRCALFYHAHFHHCPHCFGRGKRPYFQDVFAAYPYEGIARNLVHALKYGNGQALAETMAKLMLEEGASAGGCDCLIPVPLHPKKERERGYNQAAVLGRALAALLGVEFVDRALCRTVNTCSQTTLKGRERRENVAGIFALSPGAAVKDRRILLLDDVITTGSTANACAKVLRGAGAAKPTLFAFSASFF